MVLLRACVCAAFALLLVLLVCLWFADCVSVWCCLLRRDVVCSPYCGFVDFCCLMIGLGLLIVLIVFLCIVDIYFVWLLMLWFVISLLFCCFVFAA